MSGPVRDISDTAIWVAMHRARESERRDALFHDPWARQLAGPRGEEIAAALRHGHPCAMVARTLLFDEAIARQVAAGADMVANLAAGRLPLLLRLGALFPEPKDHRAGNRPWSALCVMRRTAP